MRVACGVLKAVLDLTMMLECEIEQAPSVVEINKCLNSADCRIANERKMVLLRKLRDNIYRNRTVLSN